MQILTSEQFLETEKGTQARLGLQQLVDNPKYKTLTLYDATVGRKISFVDRHLSFLARHPYINADTYITNLKVMTRHSR